MVLSPDGHQLYVTDGNSDAVSVVDTDTQKEIGRISTALLLMLPSAAVHRG
jgi:YVTN family beta-propeller protein